MFSRARQALSFNLTLSCTLLRLLDYCVLALMPQVSFTQFKRKLALVPVIFFVLRLPGNILCIWLYLEPTANTASASQSRCVNSTALFLGQSSQA